MMNDKKDFKKRMMYSFIIFMTICAAMRIGSHAIGEMRSNECIEEDCDIDKEEETPIPDSSLPRTNLHIYDEADEEPSEKSNSSSGSVSNKSSDTDDSYGEGYDDVYMNEDYDLDRYYEDDEYASGVDDAIDEEIEETGDEDW